MRNTDQSTLLLTLGVALLLGCTPKQPAKESPPPTPPAAAATTKAAPSGPALLRIKVEQEAFEIRDPKRLEGQPTLESLLPPGSPPLSKWEMVSAVGTDGRKFFLKKPAENYGLYDIRVGYRGEQLWMGTIAKQAAGHKGPVKSGPSIYGLKWIHVSTTPAVDVTKEPPTIELLVDGQLIKRFGAEDMSPLSARRMDQDGARGSRGWAVSEVLELLLPKRRIKEVRIEGDQGEPVTATIKDMADPTSHIVIKTTRRGKMRMGWYRITSDMPARAASSRVEAEHKVIGVTRFIVTTGQ